MSGFWRFSSTIVALLFILPNRVPAEDASAEITELAAIITAQRLAVSSMQGSFIAETSADSLAEASKLMANIVVKSSIDFAWSREKRYLKADDQTPRSGKLLQVAATNVFDGKEFRRRERKTFLIQKEKSSAAEGNQFMNGLFWSISDNEIKNDNQNPDKTRAIPYCFRAPGWEIGGPRVAVDGVLCIVVQNRKMGRRYLFAPGLGYCLIRAEFDQPRALVRHETFEYKNIKEVSRGFYLPMEITETADMFDKQKNATGKLTTRLVARDIQINNVPDSVFVLKPKAGDRVIDNIRGSTYDFVPPDDNTLELSARMATQQSAFSSGRSLLYWLIFPIGIAIGLGVVFSLRWWSRNRRAIS